MKAFTELEVLLSNVEKLGNMKIFRQENVRHFKLLMKFSLSQISALLDSYLHVTKLNVRLVSQAFKIGESFQELWVKVLCTELKVEVMSPKLVSLCYSINPCAFYCSAWRC